MSTPDAAAMSVENWSTLLDTDDLATILAIAANGQSGRVTPYELRALVETYRDHASLTSTVERLREALALCAGGFEGEGLEIENEWRRTIARNALNGVPLSEYERLEARAALSIAETFGERKSLSENGNNLSKISERPANQPGTDIERLREALKSAEQFIVNGVEFGFIRMPDVSTPDSAHDTLPKIRAALSSIPDNDQQKSDDIGRLREALLLAEGSFESIRTKLVKNLDEPERSAFWLAVRARDSIRAALSSIPAPEPEVHTLASLQDRLRYGVANATHTQRRRAELQAADAIDNLETALAASNERVVHYQNIAGKQGSMLFRKDILLKTSRQWGISSHAYDAGVAVAIADAIDAGIPLAWPSSPFAQQWLTDQGYSDCGGVVGMRLTMKLAEGVAISSIPAPSTEAETK